MKTSRFLLSAVLLSASLVAHADVFTFTQTGSQPISFTIDTSGPSLDVNPGGAFVYLDNNSDLVFFYNTVAGGGFSVGLLQDFGPQLYIGPESAPTIVPGTYSLNNPAVNANDTLVISSTATPEPSSFTLLFSGLAAAGAAARRRRWLTHTRSI
jgi:PEP-CTERM motif